MRPKQSSWKINSIGRDGAPLSCWTCKSIFHIQKFCEHYYTNDKHTLFCDDDENRKSDSRHRDRELKLELERKQLEINELHDKLNETKWKLENKECIIDNLMKEITVQNSTKISKSSSVSMQTNPSDLKKCDSDMFNLADQNIDGHETEILFLRRTLGSMISDLITKTKTCGNIQSVDCNRNGVTLQSEENINLCNGINVSNSEIRSSEPNTERVIDISATSKTMDSNVNEFPLPKMQCSKNFCSEAEPCEINDVKCCNNGDLSDSFIIEECYDSSDTPVFSESCNDLMTTEKLFIVNDVFQTDNQYKSEDSSYPVYVSALHPYYCDLSKITDEQTLDILTEREELSEALKTCKIGCFIKNIKCRLRLIDEMLLEIAEELKEMRDSENDISNPTIDNPVNTEIPNTYHEQLIENPDMNTNTNEQIVIDNSTSRVINDSITGDVSNDSRLDIESRPYDGENNGEQLDFYKRCHEEQLVHYELDNFTCVQPLKCELAIKNNSEQIEVDSESFLSANDFDMWSNKQNINLPSAVIVSQFDQESINFIDKPNRFFCNMINADLFSSLDKLTLWD